MSHEQIFVTFFKLGIYVGKIVTHFSKLGNFNFYVTISGVVGRKGGWVGELARPPRDVTKTILLGNHKSRGCWEGRLAPQCHFPNNPNPLLIKMIKERKDSFLRDNTSSFQSLIYFKRKKKFFLT